ncbi:hypothetical protein I6G82_07105 [Lysinibacillus macroides]|uniref:Uncharacterized protein n=1 Tax=Lysinibacillus macroides TaxID=33935 RepID=A0A0N0CWU8_9BACI|nr:hypothetical protein [Lysinibacillus macroides]KOY83494.1 hypothetical protein ADM90_09595 [Lysinibacillus macroides]QPR70511.1 hypothetical protein I6G82_07105 [Lysinibacillus macroides]
MNGLEISGTIQKTKNARFIKVLSSMMTGLIVIFVRCGMNGKRRHVMTRIVTTVYNAIGKFFSFFSV